MIRKWMPKSKSSKARQTRSYRDSGNNSLCQFEQLEEKQCLAFVGAFDGVTLTLTQTFDDGDVVFDNAGPGSSWQWTDNSDSKFYVNAENLIVNMLDGTANQVTVRILSTHSEDITLNLGEGPRDVDFPGGNPFIPNTVGGNLTINGGAEPQVIALSPNPINPLTVNGDLTMHLGTGFDEASNNSNFLTINGNVDMIGVNRFEYFDRTIPVPNVWMTVGGNFSMDTSNESIESFLLEENTFVNVDRGNNVNQRSTIFGNFTYIGGDDIDHVDLNNTYIAGNVTIDLGDGIPFFGDPQNVTTTFTNFIQPGGFPFIAGQIDGNIDIKAGDSNLGNNITLDAEFFGDTVRYEGGNKVDTVNYLLKATPFAPGGTLADVTAIMGGGDDVFNLFTNVNSLDIDFGNDFGDTFNNFFGEFVFDSDITNFHHWDFLFTIGNDTMIANQLFDNGDITFDNDAGASGVDWRMTDETGRVAATTGAATLFVNMLDFGGDLEMDLVNPVIAFLNLNVGDGDRNIDFTGEANNPLRDINITGNLGVQTVELSVNAPLAVATLNVNLGEGYDVVDDDANNLLISEDLIFTGVNFFENDGVLSVARDVVIDSTVEVADTIFGTNGNMIVGSTFTYRGGDGRDELRLNGADGTSIVGNVNIALGDNTTGGTQMALFDNAFTTIASPMVVSSTAGIHPDVFRMDPATRLDGNLTMDLGDGPNTAEIVGVFGGSNVMYTGGTGVDLVTYGLTGSPADLLINLGEGDDTFHLLAGASIAPNALKINFGDNNDTFISDYGSFDFNAELIELSGFNHIYNAATQTLMSTQVSDRGDVLIDNNGFADGIRFINAGMNAISPATSLTVEMLGDTGNSLTVDFDNAHTGDVTIDLSTGDRTVDFTGDMNAFGGDLTVTAADGQQDVGLAVMAGLTVTGTASFDLGADSDAILMTANGITTGGDLFLNGANSVVLQGTTNVAGNFTVDASGENTDSVFDASNNLLVGGNFAFASGNATDTVTIAGTTSIAGNAVVDLGNGGAGNQLAELAGTASIGGALNVSSTNATSKDTFESTASNFVGTSVSIAFGDGENEATILNTMGGSNVNYTGGSGVDTVVLGTTGAGVTTDISLGAADDSFTLLAGTNVGAMLGVDFGTGNDSFDNQYGDFDFNADLKGLNGFDHNYDHGASSLSSTQVENLGNVTVDTNGGGGAVRFSTGGVVSEITPVDNLAVTMLDDAISDLAVDLDNPLPGDLTVNLGNGDRAANFTGSNNSVGGNLTVTGGAGAQIVEIAVNENLTVGGDATFDLGADDDRLDENGNDITIGGSLTLAGVNTFESEGALSFTGDLTIDHSADAGETLFALQGTNVLPGNFNFTGGSGKDDVMLGEDTTVMGDVNIDLGENSSDDVQIASVAGTTIGGTTNITGRAGNDRFFSNPSTSFGGDVTVKLGDGDNSAVIVGNFMGDKVDYVGGVGSDDVTFGTTGSAAIPNIKLRGGDDMFTLASGAVVDNKLRVDFGGGTDQFDNDYGNFDFDASFLNFNGFNRFYNLAADNVNFAQIEDTGDVVLDNNGTNNALRLISNGVPSEMTAANDTRILLLDNTSTNVDVDLDHAHNGNLTVQMRSGQRTVRFTGDSNTVNGLLRIEASEGLQDVYLAVNADLNANTSLVINGRNGYDRIFDSGNRINVAEALILRGMNQLQITNRLNVAGDFNMITSLENQYTSISSIGQINIGGNVTWLGGGGVDDILLTAGGINIGGFMYVNLGEGNDANNAQSVNLAGGFTGTQLVVTGGNSLGGNEVWLDEAANLSGDLIINFAGTATMNRATIFGNLTGTYGTFRGGSAGDEVNFGAIAPGMEFAGLTNEGNDIFVVQTTTELDYLFFDFGAGADEMFNNFGSSFPFASGIINL